MAIIRKMFEKLDGVLHFDTAYAHCDIPCGIYDPHTAQMAAHTVIRMVNLINDLTKSGAMEPADMQKFVRCVHVKEEHAELCKKEIRILWGDYFKPEHAKAYPELNDLVWKAMKLASQARQEINIDASKQLLDTIEKIAVIFWKTKNIETMTVKSPYPSGETIVYPKV